MKHLYALLLSFFLLISISFAQDAQQWRGKNRDGIYDGTNLLAVWPADGPKLKWHYDSLGEGFGSACVTKDRIFLAGAKNGIGKIFALTYDGVLVWSTEYGEEWTESFPGTRSTPLYNNERIYLLSGFGKLVCLNAIDGKLIWAVDVMKDYSGRNIKWGFTENLLIDGDKLFCTVGGIKDNIIALDKNTGKLIWSNPGNGDLSAYCSPALIQFPDRKIVVTMTEKSILGFDAESGKKLWSHEQINKWSVHANTPIFQNGFLYCMSGYGCGGVMLKLSADGLNIEKVWKNDSLDSKMGGAVVVNDRIYGFGDKTKGFYCIDLKTGKVIAYEKQNNKLGTIISAAGLIYTYDESGEVALLEPIADGFKKISSFKAPFGTSQHWAHPVIDRGTLYIRHGSSIMVYDIRK